MIHTRGPALPDQAENIVARDKLQREAVLWQLHCGCPSTALSGSRPALQSDTVSKILWDSRIHGGWLLPQGGAHSICCMKKGAGQWSLWEVLVRLNLVAWNGKLVSVIMWF